MTKALFAGSFDPFTQGHLSIVERALEMFDSVVIAIGHNEHKRGEWTVEERVSAISEYFKNNDRVSTESFTGLTVDFARKCGATVLLRSVRGAADFEYEKNLADINKAISGLDTVLLISLPQLAFISSSIVREIIHNGYDARKYIVGNFNLPVHN
ncbi:MAG: pantetheine-phosphate adenylyltransferase [Muribaculaceae bacterium]|nr:pantetheine-phosphate adenylyltransferase [Muribaculaceae bacterium]